jgi:hypothetical protein
MSLAAQSVLEKWFFGMLLSITVLESLETISTARTVVQNYLKRD